MACHAHKDYDPKDLPEAAKPFAKANFGPNLSNIAAKFDEKNGFKWLANWLKAPEAYHPKSLMPNLQLSWEESADIARYLLSVKADADARRAGTTRLPGAEGRLAGGHGGAERAWSGSTWASPRPTGSGRSCSVGGR